MDATVEIANKWQMFADTLGVFLISPVDVYGDDGAVVRCLSFVRDFGSRNGTMVGLTYPPGYEIDESLIGFAKKKGMHFSFVTYDYASVAGISDFSEMLSDWGYFGAPDKAPGFIDDIII